MGAFEDLESALGGVAVLEPPTPAPAAPPAPPPPPPAGPDPFDQLSAALGPPPAAAAPPPATTVAPPRGLDPFDQLSAALSGGGGAPATVTQPYTGRLPSDRAAPYVDMIRNTAQRNGLDPALLAALVQQESGFNPNIGSSAGAQGLTQLMPETARGLGVRNIHDPQENLDAGARYLKTQIDRYGSPELGLAAYNAGPGAVDKYGGIPPFRETQAHGKNILALQEQWRPVFAGAATAVAEAPSPTGASAAPPKLPPPPISLPKFDTSGITAATKDIPLIGGLFGAAGEVAGQVGRGLESAIPAGGQAFAESIQQAATQLPIKAKAVFDPGPPPEGGFGPKAGWPAVPELAGEIVSAAFTPIKAAIPVLDVGASVFGQPAAGAMAAGAMMTQAGVLRAQGQDAQADRLFRTAQAMLTDPTNAAKAAQIAWNESGAGDMPVIGGFIDDWLLSGQLLNPLNLVGFGAPGKLATLMRNVPAVGGTLRLASYMDNAAAFGLGAPISVPLKAASITAPRIPIVGKLFQESATSKMAGDGARTINAGRAFFTRGGDEVQLGRLAAGDAPASIGALRNFKPNEQKEIVTFAKAYGEAKRASGGVVNQTTEGELINVLITANAKKYGVNLDPRGLRKAVDMVNATIKEGWLGFNPAFVGQNAIEAVAKSFLHGIAPMGEVAYANWAKRRGYAPSIGGQGFVEATFGKVDAQGKGSGLFSMIPGLGDLQRIQRNVGAKVENSGKQAAIHARAEDVIKRGLKDVADITDREAKKQGLSSATRKRIREVIMAHEGRVDELVGKLKGGANAWAHTKDLGHFEDVFGTRVGSIRGRLEELNPLSSDFIAKKDAIFADEFKLIAEQIKRAAQTTPLNPTMISRLEKPAHAQAYAAFKGIDNPERLREMLGVMLARTRQISAITKQAKKLSDADPGPGRRQIWYDAYEARLDLINAGNTAIDLTRVSPYLDNAKFTQAERTAAKNAIAGLVDKMRQMHAAIQASEDSYKAAIKAGAPPPPTSLEQMWANYYQALEIEIQRVTREVDQLVKPGFNRRARGDDFWDQFIRSYADEDAGFRLKNKANITEIGRQGLADLKGWQDELNNVPAMERLLQAEGFDLMADQGVQRVIAQTAAREYGSLLTRALSEGDKFANKLFFNYAATSNLDQFLRGITPFHIWQTRNLPLWGQMLAQRPGMWRAVEGYKGMAEEQTEDDTLPASRFANNVRAQPLDAIYSMLLGRPVEMYANPLATLFGGFQQTEKEPIIPNDMPELGKAIKTIQFMGGGLGLFPWAEIPLNLSGAMGRNVAYGDIWAPSRPIRALTGIDIEKNWKQLLLDAQGIESETANPFLDAQIQRRITEITAERNLSDVEAYRAMTDVKHPLHIQARKEAEKEAGIVSMLRWVFPLGVKTLSPGMAELSAADRTYKEKYRESADQKAKSAFFAQNPGLSVYYGRNDSMDVLKIMAGQAEYYGLGSEKQRAAADRYSEATKDQTDDFKKRWADAHPQDMKDRAAYLKLQREWRANPANAETVAFLDSQFEAKDNKQTLSVEDYVKGRGLPTRRTEQDTRDPFQTLSRQLNRERGVAESADQAKINRLQDKVDAFYAGSDSLPAGKWDTYSAFGDDSRGRNAYIRANPDVAAVVDQRRKMRDGDPELDRLLDWQQAERSAGRNTFIERYLGLDKGTSASAAATTPTTTAPAAVAGRPRLSLGG